ncbi:phage tail assembly protein [Exilibacterium tricleocarpae]|uniref:Phage tail assembly protein n=1 Tax=Exilibacterium tricleocarpae TaxID=2591008 RepID=A0A545T6D8_9GAMM|nr:phage tail assembly protein [Exilibacterium tricleocarpae]
MTLTYPIDSNGGRLEELTMRRPKVRDRLAAEKIQGNQADKEVRFIANLCEVAPEEIEELDMADYARIQAVLSDFLS